MYTQISGNFFSSSFLSIQLCSRDYNFQLKGSHFGNSIAFGISGNFSGKFLSHLPLFPNFRKFWFNGKGLSYCKFAKMLFHSLLEVAENSNRTFWTLVEWNRNSCSISSKPSLIPVSSLRALFSVNETDLYKG